MRISDWSSDVCSSDLVGAHRPQRAAPTGERGSIADRDAAFHMAPHRARARLHADQHIILDILQRIDGVVTDHPRDAAGIEQGQRKPRSEEHTSELQSLMRISYDVFCLKKKNITKPKKTHT